MKKTILTVAVLAASGGYVAFANHAFDGLPGLPGAAKDVVTVTSTKAADVPVAPVAVPVAPASPTPEPAKVAAVPRVATNAPRGVVVQPAPAPVPVPAETAASTATTSGVRDGTYTGSIEDAYYGYVQVQATVKGGQLTAVDVLDYPQDRRTSRRINSIALPMLEQEAIAAQSARVDTITGATLTSRAYRASLDAALRKAVQDHA